MLEEKWLINIAFYQQNKLTIPNREKCIRDLRDHIIPAVAGDLITGGNSNIQGIIDSYLDSQEDINYIEGELLPMLDAFEDVKFLCGKALENLLVGRNENIANLTGTNAQTINDFYQYQYLSLIHI